MKGKILNKARLAGAVMLATAGIAAGTAQADSLLAPLVIHDTSAGIHTYFAMKLRGSGIPDNFSQPGQFGKYTDTIHYYYIQKMRGMPGDRNPLDKDTPVTSITGLHRYASQGGCALQNNTGFVSSWDVIYQTAHAVNNFSGLAPDNSLPNGWDVNATLPFNIQQNLGRPYNGEFYGMMVMDDSSNLPEIGTAGRRDNEGEFSGFAYIVNTIQGMVFDYKLINNHLSKASGDFSPGYISKQSIDWMWLPATNARQPNPISPTFRERTAWYTAVTGVGMSSAAENTSGSRWDEVVTFTQNPAIAGDGKQNIRNDITKKNGVAGSGAYNSDEQVVSGDRDFSIKCLGLYDRSDFLTSNQISQTVNGGWKPVHVVATSHSGDPAVVGRGALTYRFDDIAGFMTQSNVDITMQVETGGNRNAGKFGSHPNRAY